MGWVSSRRARGQSETSEAGPQRWRRRLGKSRLVDPLMPFRTANLVEESPDLLHELLVTHLLGQW